MIKRYCDICGQQIDEGVHAWYVFELHGTDGEFRHKEFCEECYEYLCEKDEVPTADRKTEPQLTPNYCGTCKYRDVPCGDLPCDVCHGYSNYEPKTEPTGYNLSPVDKDINVRSKDEPQTVDTMGEDVPMEYFENGGTWDEPQTEVDIARAIVHKMIDDSEIAEDAYPDLRQRLHDAVDEYEPQTERSE